MPGAITYLQKLRNYRSQGEAIPGYAIVRTVALPFHDRLRLEGITEEIALVQVKSELTASCHPAHPNEVVQITSCALAEIPTDAQ